MPLPSNIAGLIGTIADVDSANQLKVNLPTDVAASGYNRPVSEIDAGYVTGNPRLLAAEVSEDFRLRSELDSLWDDHKFNESAQATKKHKYATSTMTSVWGNGYLTTNGSSIVTISTGTFVQTYRQFPIYIGYSPFCNGGPQR